MHVHWIPSSYADVDTAWLNRGQYLLAFLTIGRFAPAVPLVIRGLWIVRQQSGRDVVMLVAWILAAAFGVLVQGHFYQYHWLPIYPPLALLAGIGLDALWTGITDEELHSCTCIVWRGRRWPAISATMNGSSSDPSPIEAACFLSSSRTFGRGPGRPTPFWFEEPRRASTIWVTDPPSGRSDSFNRSSTLLTPSSAGGTAGISWRA